MTTARDDRRRYISVQECAEVYSVHPMTVRKMISRGEIPSIRLGRAVRIDLRELDRRLGAQGQKTNR